MSDWDVHCPYCGTGIDICHDDGFGYEEGVAHQEDCPDCEKKFVFNTYISFSYEAFKADCLNDGNHQWVDSPTGHPLWKRRRCKDCDTHETYRAEGASMEPSP